MSLPWWSERSVIQDHGRVDLVADWVNSGCLELLVIVTLGGRLGLFEALVRYQWRL